MQFENAQHFCHGLRMLMGGMAGRDDEFGLGTFEMGTPIGHEAIAAVRGIAMTTISHDLVEGNAGSKWPGVDRLHKATAGSESVDAGGHGPSVDVIWIFDDEMANARAHLR